MKNEKPVMKKMPMVNVALKNMIDESELPTAEPFSKLWDEKIDDDFTFGDVLTNALDNSLEIEKGYFITNGDETFDLILDNDEFNIEPFLNIESEKILVHVYSKLKEMTNIEYLMSRETPIEFLFLKNESDKNQLVFHPTEAMQEIMEESDCADVENVFMHVDDLMAMDIVIIEIVDNNLSNSDSN
jgi:hypothetical protein